MKKKLLSMLALWISFIGLGVTSANAWSFEFVDYLTWTTAKTQSLDVISKGAEFTWNVGYTLTNFGIDALIDNKLLVVAVLAFLIVLYVLPWKRWFKSLWAKMSGSWGSTNSQRTMRRR